MTEQVKLTRKQLEALDKAPRIATGQSLNLNPRTRLRNAGLGYSGGRTIVVQQQNPNRRAWSGGYWHHSDRPAQARGQFEVYVVDREVFLSSGYNGYAFGEHDIEPHTWGGEENPYDKEDKDKRDSDFVIIKADKVAKAMQAILIDKGEPLPSEDEVQLQVTYKRISKMNDVLYHLRAAHKELRKLRGSEDEAQLEIETKDLWERAVGHRNRLDLQATNLSRRQEGKRELDASELSLTGLGDK